jgi:hypothetical protein
MPNFRGQVRLQGASMLPEDVYVNTFHFVRLDTLSEAADVVGPQLNTLYQTLGAVIPTYVQRAGEVRFYDLADPEPRVPEIRPITLPAPSGSATLPFEVALVVSFHGTPPVTARRRGRVYIGPLTGSALTTGGSTTEPTVATATIVSFAAAFQAFLDTGNGWSIRSIVPTENFVSVDRGWIDNEFDTQRRRGHDATERTLWGPAT